jgi:hypothetical protein
MSDTSELKALEDQLDAERRAVQVLQDKYKKALEELRVALQQQAELRKLLADPPGDALE